MLGTGTSGLRSLSGNADDAKISVLVVGRRAGASPLPVHLCVSNIPGSAPQASLQPSSCFRGQLSHSLGLPLMG